MQDVKYRNNFLHVGTIIRVVWFSLDLVIVLIYCLRCKRVRFPKWVFISLYIIEASSLIFVFEFISKGQLLSVFLIDAIMAIAWCFYGNYKELVIKPIAIGIGFLKLIGDFFAWLSYRDNHPFIYVIGIIVLIANSVYILILLVRNNQSKRHF